MTRHTFVLLGILTLVIAPFAVMTLVFAEWRDVGDGYKSDTTTAPTGPCPTSGCPLGHPTDTAVPRDASILLSSNRDDLAICVDSVTDADTDQLAAILRDAEPVVRSAEYWTRYYVGRAFDKPIRIDSGCPDLPLSGSRNCVLTPSKYRFLAYLIPQDYGGATPNISERDHPYGLSVELSCGGDTALPVTDALLFMPDDICDPDWIKTSLVNALGLNYPGVYRTPAPCP